MNKPSLEQAREEVAGIRLLPLGEFRAPFPDATIRGERILGAVKSYVAYRPADERPVGLRGSSIAVMPRGLGLRASYCRKNPSAIASTGSQAVRNASSIAHHSFLKAPEGSISRSSKGSFHLVGGYAAPFHIEVTK